MTLSIEQSSEYTGNDHWRWQASIAGTPAELARVEKVKWFLHPSFTPSVVVSRERARGFPIEASGWGTFTLRAELHFVDGSDKTLRERLRLFYPEGESAEGESAADESASPESPVRAEPATTAASAAAGGPVRRVFLSYAAADRSNAQALRQALEKIGVRVLDATAIDAGQPWQLALQDLMAGADATVALVSGDLPSSWVAQEIDASARAGKPTMVVLAGEGGDTAGLPTEVPVLRLPQTSSIALAEAAPRIAQALQQQQAQLR